MQDRILSFEGVRNFRDFGGYPTEGGGRVADGLLYRSAHFAEATDEDVEKIRTMGIRIVCDLRRPEERKTQANRWPTPECATRALFSEDGGLDEPPHIAFLKSGDLTPAAVHAFMRNLYAEIPFDARYVSLFSDFLRHLAEDDAPALVHCAAGKDRTGILCALTLISLEVPEDVIVEDYELTNTAVDLTGRLPMIRERFQQMTGVEIPTESILPFLGVDVSYLATAMDMMQKRCGSIHGYMDEILGIDEEMREAMRERLVIAS
ncbi:MAG: tyrosine-protein phosphatase [Hyphomonadaceae bacterium]